MKIWFVKIVQQAIKQIPLESVFFSVNILALIAKKIDQMFVHLVMELIFLLEPNVNLMSVAIRLSAVKLVE